MAASRSRPLKQRLLRCPKPEIRAYADLWPVVSGAIHDALKCHPDYVRSGRRATARNSIAKRVVGAVLAYATQSFAAQAARGRSVRKTAADQVLSGSSGGAPGPVLGPETAGVISPSGWLTVATAASRFSMRGTW